METVAFHRLFAGSLFGCLLVAWSDRIIWTCLNDSNMSPPIIHLLYLEISTLLQVTEKDADGEVSR